MEQLRGALRMWRIWHLTHKNELQALVNSHIWRRGVNIADGPMNLSNSTGGGFYGFDGLHRIQQQEQSTYDWWRNGCEGTSPSFRNTSSVVIGSILGFGEKVLIAPMGARVRRAQPEYLILSGHFAYDVRLMETATKYGMKPITWDQGLTLKTGLVPFHEGMIIK